jgi:hypothetical protein
MELSIGVFCLDWNSYVSTHIWFSQLFHVFLTSGTLPFQIHLNISSEQQQRIVVGVSCDL